MKMIQATSLETPDGYSEQIAPNLREAKYGRSIDSEGGQGHT
jgi:hypothetical protein